MGRDPIEEIRALMQLAREVNAQRIRQAAGEAFCDDVTQKMAVNRALFAAGYGIDPRPYAAPPATTSRSETTPAAQPPAQPPASLAAKLAPWVVGAALAAGGSGLTALWTAAKTVAPVPAATSPADAGAYEFGLMPPVER